MTRWSNVAFVALDANDVSYEITKNQGYTGGAQQPGSATTLAALRADPAIDFIVVGFHHCMYCSNTCTRRTAACATPGSRSSTSTASTS